MARPPRPENANNPLRQLRGRIGKRAPVTQNQLAEICALSLDTIRSIEAGRRSLGLPTRQKILEATGARWSDKNRDWFVSADESLPFDFAAYRAYRRFLIEEPSDDQKTRDLGILRAKIEFLLEEIPTRFRHNLLLRLNDSLEQCQKAFRLKQLSDFFDTTRPRLMILRRSKGGEIAAVQRYYPIEFQMARSKNAKRSDGQVTD